MEPRERRTQAAQQRALEELTTGIAAETGTAAGRIAPGAGHPVLAEIERSGSLPPGATGAQAFACVVGALARFLPSEQAADFVRRHLPAALSTLVEGAALDRDGDDTARGDAAEYVAQVAAELEIDEAQAEELARAVIAALRVLTSGEEVEAVAAELPPGLEALWREASDVPGAPGHSGMP